MEDWVRELELASRTDPSILSPQVLLGIMGEGHWSLRMDVCRMISRVEWDGADAERAKEFAMEQYRDRNTFVRAWALEALSFLAVQDFAFRDVVLELVDEALENGSASVKVQARKALKRLM